MTTEGDAMTEEFTKVEFLVKGDEGQMAKMIEHIRSSAIVGHSFEIVVDPDSDETRKFYADGDGAFFIKDVKVDGRKFKVDKEGNVLESYLSSL